MTGVQTCALPIWLPAETPDTEHNADFQQVSPAYFDVLGIPLVAGRNFRSGDEERNVVLINESLARRYFDGSNPVGKSIVQRTTSEIVGVVRDANLAYIDGPLPTLFTPIAGDQIPKVLVRSSAAAQQALDAIAKRIEPRARVQVTPLSDNLDEQLSGSRTMAAIAGALGVFALVLASIGISGVFAYIVEQRWKEIGIRMALGAAPTHVIGLVLSGAAWAALWGLVIGYVAAAGFARFMAQYLYGVSPYDPRSYATVGAVLIIAGLAAAYLPARRATNVDPLTALRLE